MSKICSCPKCGKMAVISYVHNRKYVICGSCTFVNRRDL